MPDALTNLVQQAPGHERWCGGGDFVGFVGPVDKTGMQRQVHDVQSFFGLSAPTLSDFRRAYPVIGRLHQSRHRNEPFIGEFESGDKQYLDMSALKKERGYVRVKTMINYKKPVWSVTSKKVSSETGTDYIDCKNRRFMILEAASYECPMARCEPKENASYPYDEKKFKPISSTSSQVGNVFDLVCQ